MASNTVTVTISVADVALVDGNAEVLFRTDVGKRTSECGLTISPSPWATRDEAFEALRQHFERREPAPQ